MFIKSLVYFSCLFVGFGIAFPRVEVTEGILEGIAYATEEGKTAHKFLGVPFASPPVGDLRFKAPQPALRWRGIRKAKNFGNICKSYTFENETTGNIFHRYCLYLNVYTSNINPTNQLYPVMVFISGGGFQVGLREYTSDWLIMEDVILVTFAYRVGVFGFLSLDIEEAPGNAGLKDQVAALKWIKRNIAEFGGDSGNITVFGQSAGAASLNYHLVSDMSKGLFQKAAMMSGSSLNPWAYVNNPKKFGIKLSHKLGCPTASGSDALECLLSIPSDELLQMVGESAPSTAMADDNKYFQELVFLPSIEQSFPSHEAFLTESAHHRMKTGNFHKVPIMAGFTNAECINEVNDTIVDRVFFGLIDIDFERYVPRELGLESGSKGSIFIADQIKKFYYGEDPIDENIENFIVIKSDTSYKRGINEMVKLLAVNSSQPVYYYRFSFYDPDLRRGNDLMLYEGASHADDLFFLLFDTDILPRYKLKVERTRKRLVKLYTNFAKYGNPTPNLTELLPVKWAAVTSNKLNYFSIGENLHLSTNPDRSSIQFWENLVKNATRGI